MIVALSFHGGDTHLADELLRWIGKLSDCSAFDCILVCDGGTPFDKVIEVKARAECGFKSATVVATEKSVAGWPAGPNSNWRTAIHWGRVNNQPILFLETDAIPLKPSWLSDISDAYEKCEKQHMGAIYPSGNVQLPPTVMSGVAVYGPKCEWSLDAPLIRAFNVDMAELFLSDACHTDLIRDFFGTKEKPPVFVEIKGPASPVNTLTLDFIPDAAVIFHRDKTQSLIPLLAKRLGIAWEPPKRKAKPICVVFNVHNGDIQLALHHALWLRKLGRKNDHPAIITFDSTLPPGLVSQLKQLLDPCFAIVDVFRYPTPAIATYPASANWAFQSAAFYAENFGHPWLWFEADAVVLKADWLDQLQAEYETCGKTFMGPKVVHMGHLQGTSIYPFDAGKRLPRAMNCGAHEAFDMAAKEDMGTDMHDCSRIFHHVWSILNDAPCPVGGGTVPGDLTADQARRWLPKEAVITHRWKTRSLVDLLLTGTYKHE